MLLLNTKMLFTRTPIDRNPSVLCHSTPRRLRTTSLLFFPAFLSRIRMDDIVKRAKNGDFGAEEQQIRDVKNAQQNVKPPSTTRAPPPRSGKK
jgi:hypothetical protein